MAWQIEGTYFENCSCDSVCPCTSSSLQKPADLDYCHAVLAFHVNSGAMDGVDLADRTAVLVMDTPKLMADGNWRVGLIIDDAASEEQADALGQVFGGQAGGPIAALAPLIGEMLGVERAPIQHADEGRRHSLKVGDTIDIEVQDMAPPDAPESIATQLTNVNHPANTTLTVASATRSRVTAFGFDWDQTGKSGFSAPFSWSA